MFQIFLVIVLISTIIFFKRKSQANQKLPPGPIRWPIVGSLPQMIMADSSYFHLQAAALTKKYGKIVSFGFGSTYSILVSDFGIMKDLFRRPELNYKKLKFDFLEQRSNNKNLGIVWASGDLWKEQRKLTMKLLRQFGFGKKHTMDETIQAEVNDLIPDLKEEFDSNGIWEVNANRLSLCIINILWAFVGGYRFDPRSPKINRHLELQLEIFESLGPKNLLGAFPFLRIFPKWSGYERVCELQDICRQFTLELIEDAKGQRQGCLEPETFIEAYLDEIEKNKTNPYSNITEEQLVLILMDLFLGGSDTSSAALNWIILYVALYPNVQSKARDEINRYTEDGAKLITATAINSMPYIHAIILETMRHAPYISSTLPRVVMEDIQCAGYTLPKGTCAFYNFYSLFHDPEVWGDPENFRPERLLQPDGLTLDSEKADRVAQFGLGARACPGENLAMTSMFMVTVALLQNFEFETIPGRQPSLDPGTPSLTIKPQLFSLKVKTRGK